VTSRTLGIELNDDIEEAEARHRHVVGQFEGGVHGGSPTRDWGKPSLYRGGRPEERSGEKT